MFPENVEVFVRRSVGGKDHSCGSSVGKTAARIVSSEGGATTSSCSRTSKTSVAGRGDLLRPQQVHLLFAQEMVRRRLQKHGDDAGTPGSSRFSLHLEEEDGDPDVAALMSMSGSGFEDVVWYLFGEKRRAVISQHGGVGEVSQEIVVHEVHLALSSRKCPTFSDFSETTGPAARGELYFNMLAKSWTRVCGSISAEVVVEDGRGHDDAPAVVLVENFGLTVVPANRARTKWSKDDHVQDHWGNAFVFNLQSSPRMIIGASSVNSKPKETQKSVEDNSAGVRKWVLFLVLRSLLILRVVVLGWKKGWGIRLGWKFLEQVGRTMC